MEIVVAFKLFLQLYIDSETDKEWTAKTAGIIFAMIFWVIFYTTIYNLSTIKKKKKIQNLCVYSAKIKHSLP